MYYDILVEITEASRDAAHRFCSRETEVGR